MKNSRYATAVKIIALCSFFFIVLPFWSLGQTKEKEEAEKQIAPTLPPQSPHFVALQGPKTIYCKPYKQPSDNPKTRPTRLKPTTIIYQKINS